MGEPLDSIAKVFLGALLTWLFAIWRERKRDRQAREHAESSAKVGRKLAFLCKAYSLVAEIDQTSNERFVEWCRTSIIKVSGESAALTNDIDDSRRERFRTAGETFCATKRPDIEDRKRTDLPALAAQPTTYNRGRERMRGLLKEMIECAK